MKSYFKYIYFFLFILLSFTEIKFAGMRVGQVFLLFTFILIIIDDYNNKQIDWELIFFFELGAIVMILISLNSIEGKIDEYKFFIKYVIVFMASFYIGAKALQKVEVKDFITILESIVAFYIIMAFLIYFHLLPDAIISKIVHYRTGYGGYKYLEFQGTFHEAIWLALAIYIASLSAFLLRFRFHIFPKNRNLLYLYYIIVFISLVLTKNKTVFLSLIFAAIFLFFLKSSLTLIYSNYYKREELVENIPALKTLNKINMINLLFFTLFVGLIFYIANELLPEPLITKKLLLTKLKHERGEAFVVTWHLIEKSNFFGGYGFGFVEDFFSHYPTTIIGLGQHVSMIFNSYLDIWLSASIFGLIFHLLLLYISFSSRYFLTIVLPVVLFAFANFNPIIGDENYYIFLGLSYGLIQKYQKQREEYA